MNPAISVAMIVKNESAHLPECLAGLAGFADEICVVDTGSTDDTIAIAERFGCRLGRVAWRNDFAAARNASLDLCTGAWIFILDADERVAPEDRAILRDLVAQQRQCGYRLITRNYTDAAHLSEFTPCAPDDPWARGFAGWYPSGKVRLFPNGLGARFVGKVHELVNQSLIARGVAIETNDAPVHHYPLTKSTEFVQAKRRLYLELGREKLKETPDDARLYVELAAQYAELGEYGPAVNCLRNAVRLDASHPEYFKELGVLLHLAGYPAEGAKALEIATRMDPALVEAWRNLGVVRAACGAWDAAQTCFARALALTPQDSEAHRYHAVALQHLGRLEEARRDAETAARLNPTSAAARDLLRSLAE